MNNNDDTPTPKKVVIVGAGFAGLSVAYHLLLHNKVNNHNNVEVEILEARDRIGGRVHPYDLDGTGTGTTMVDLGGQWVHEASAQNPIRHIMQTLEIPFHRNSSSSSMDYKKQPKQQQQHKKNVIFDKKNGQEISQGVIQMASRLFYKALHSYEIKDVTVTTSLRDLLDEQLQLQMASDDRISKIPAEKLQSTLNYLIHRTECYEGGRLEELSASLADLYQNKGGPDEIPEGGYHSVLTALAAKIIGMEARIRLECMVDSIQYEPKNSNTNDGKVTITLQQQQQHDDDDLVIHADYCVCTVPLGVLQQRTIRFVPDLSFERRKAMDAMGMGLLDKIVLKFEDCFWGDHGSFGVADSDPTRIQSYYDASSEVGAPCLIVFLGGDAARRLETQLSDEEAVDEVMTNLRSIFGSGGGGDIIVSNPVATKVTRWYQDPFSFGSYSFAKVGCTEKMYDTVAEPLGNLLFAGEHTSKTSHSTVHGAWETGQREAKRLCELLSSSKE